MDDLMRRIEDVSEAPRHVYRLARFLVGQRTRLSDSYRVLADSPERLEDIFYEASLVSRRHSDRWADLQGRSDLVREWTGVLLDAVERVERENRWGDLYATMRSDDDSFPSASAAHAGQRWGQAR